MLRGQKNWKFLTSHTDFLFILLRFVGKRRRKWSTEKNGCHRPFKRLNRKQRNGCLLYMCLESFLSARAWCMTAWHCSMNYVRNRDAPKQLGTRTKGQKGTVFYEVQAKKHVLIGTTKFILAKRKASRKASLTPRGSRGNAKKQENFLQ